MSYFDLVAVATQKKQVELENGDGLRKGAGFRKVEGFRRVEVAMLYIAFEGSGSWKWERDYFSGRGN